MMKKALLCCLMLAAILTAAFAAPASAAPINTSGDITIRCKFRLPVNPLQEGRLFDGDARTYWEALTAEESYIQFYKPAGEASLSVLWAKLPAQLSLEKRANGESVLLQFWDGEDGAFEKFMPQLFELPEPAGLYRLSAGEGGMAVSELRVHDGIIIEDFFTAYGYADSTVLWEDTAVYAKPIGRGSPPTRQIKDAQRRLAALGYYVGQHGGTVDDLTHAALLRFQHANGLYPSGAYDTATAFMLDDPFAIANEPTAHQERLPRLSSVFIDYLKENIGAGYIYGGDGQICSPMVRGAAVRLYPEYYELLSGYATRWDGLPVFDCGGLMRGFLESTQGAYPNEWRVNVNTAAQNWMLGGVRSIETMPREPGVLLLQEHPTLKGTFIHMGAYLGDGVSVHARGHRYGVVTDPMPQFWTHWAKPVWLKYDLPEDTDHAPWPDYMGPGTWVMADTSTGEPIHLYTKPVQSKENQIGSDIPNYTELLIRSMVEGEPYWRFAAAVDIDGNQVTGYVFAKDLSLLE